MQARYRVEDGVPCIDVRAQRVEQLFDNRDPAPFGDRDLDPDLVTYLLEASEDLTSHGELAVVFWLEQEAAPGELEQAYRGHFEEMIERLRRQRRRERRVGTITLLLGIVIVLVLISMAQIVGATVRGSLGAGLREGLVISSWVVLWRPVNILIYGWIPVRQERRLALRLFAATLSVRAGKPPPP